ncbi:MAG TPA: helix-turn-helix domain-containing protein [Candidatus Omnitrophota bacterium]|nr:helix-turn-helix domain-containing protein [Candidatus Omnitrophota bacterium]
MNFNTLLEYFEEAQAFKHIQEIICILCGATLEIRSLDGRIFKCNYSPASHQSRYGENQDTHADCQYRTEGCDSLISVIIEKATSSGKMQINKCRAGFTKILLPIEIRQQIVGYLLVSEPRHFRLSQQQIRAIINLLGNFLSDISQELNQFANVKENTMSYQQKIVEKVAYYINANYHRPDLSLRSLCEETGLSYHYLSRLIKKVLKTSFTQYLNRIRLQVASRLLQNKSLSVTEIAYACGYEDPGYFCKLFKKGYGQTPGFYRVSQTSRRLTLPKSHPRLVPVESCL